MINEANEPSSACRLWRTYQVETSTPPFGKDNMHRLTLAVKSGPYHYAEVAYPPATCHNMRVRKNVGLLLLTLAAVVLPLRASAAFVELDPPTTVSGYLASLLINEAPFPGENGYVSEQNTQATMLAILWVLDSRIYHIPPGYQQIWVAGVQTTNIVDVIVGTGEKRQCEGFYRDASGRFVSDARVRQRINYLLNIANGGGKPGRFANLLNYAQGLARAYVKGGMEGADRFAGLKKVGPVAVTGRAYSWMTDKDYYRPGGNFVSIPDKDDGSLGGNRFFTLRKATQ
jgi:hypothetical protein